MEDLAEGHIAALNKINLAPDLITVNLGTGKPLSVLELIKAFTEVSNKKIPYEITSRRLGDLAEYYAEPSLSKKILGWSANLDTVRMC